MQIKKRLSMLFFTVCLVFVMSSGMVYAHEVPDMEKTGSVSVAMACEGKAVPGGTLMLYQVGEIYEDNGNYSFILTKAFEKSGVSLDNLSSASLASELAAYVSANSLIGTETEIGNDGKAIADGLALGLYLVVQPQAADGYEAVAPFLVSVPMNEDGTYLYDVDATPKMSLLTEKTPTPVIPTESGKPVTPTVPGTSVLTYATLPQTGQLNWPVPVLAALGLCLFFTGWALRFNKWEQPYEA